MMTNSKAETLKHIHEVRKSLYLAAGNLLRRGDEHDMSKLESPEVEEFDRIVGRLEGLTYGSDEYKKSIEDLKPALDHHYKMNSHHPEHYSNGIDGMDLFDVVEMLFDWVAAVNRHKDGNILKSLEINTKRFDMSPQLVNIFRNTLISQGIIEKQALKKVNE